jgi:hypothetical protein
MGCEVAGKLTRRRLVDVVITIEGALLMYRWIDSPGRDVDVSAPFIRFLVDVIASVSINFAEARHFLTTAQVKVDRGWSTRLQLLVVENKESVAKYEVSIGGWIRCVYRS